MIYIWLNDLICDLKFTFKVDIYKWLNTLIYGVKLISEDDSFWINFLILETLYHIYFI